MSRYKTPVLHLTLFQGLEVHLAPPERASQRGAQWSSARTDELEGNHPSRDTGVDRPGSHWPGGRGEGDQTASLVFGLLVRLQGEEWSGG